uniref:SCP domain-containing protein n=1 Tax=Strongyloides stercoralis TaxID=6248 RepID=A0A0K0E6J1_STRER
MWSTPSLYIVMFILFGFLSLSSGFSYHITQVRRGRNVHYLYKGRHYRSYSDAMAQVRRDRDEYLRRITRKPPVVVIIRNPTKKPVRTRRPVRPVSKLTWRPRPIAGQFTVTPKPPIITRAPAPRPVPTIARHHPKPTNPPTTIKIVTKGTDKPNVVTQIPPKNRIDPIYIPKPKDVDDLYPFSIDREKVKNSGPFSIKVFDEVWKGYDYKSDYKTGYLDMRNRILEETNRYREAHGVEPLTYDYDLEKASQKYAKYLADRNLFDHDPLNKQNAWGENLARMSAALGPLATKRWYDEVDMYDFVNKRYVPGTGHFTQLVWKDTKKVGCGIYLKREDLYVVCKYTPQGNFRDEFAEKVLPRLAKYN